MAEDPVENYQDAVKLLQSAISRVKKLVYTIRSAVQILEHWRTAQVTNVEVRFPPGIAMRIANTINGHQWPSAQELAAALADYHTAKSAVENAWDAIPDSRRTGLRPPEDCS